MCNACGLALFDDDEEDGDDWALDTLQCWNEQVSSVPHFHCLIPFCRRVFGKNPTNDPDEMENTAPNDLELAKAQRRALKAKKRPQEVQPHRHHTYCILLHYNISTTTNSDHTHV
jgi:hypothetical protein